MDAQPETPRNRILIGVGAAVAVLAVVLAVVVLSSDDDEVGTSATTTSGDTTTTGETTTTVFAPTVNPAVPIFPDPGTSQRFEDPVAVATAWATEVVGFRDPVVDPFQSGDNRSGEVEVRSFAEGAPTVVLVRQLEDDTWFVIGAVTDSIQLATPAAGDTITSPQPLVGMAYAFEGTVVVQLYVDGTQEPIEETFVTGRGDGVLGDFSGELTFTDTTGATHGVLVLTSNSGEDGAPIEASVIRVKL